MHTRWIGRCDWQRRRRRCPDRAVEGTDGRPRSVCRLWQHVVLVAASPAGRAGYRVRVGCIGFWAPSQKNFRPGVVDRSPQCGLPVGAGQRVGDLGRPGHRVYRSAVGGCARQDGRPGPPAHDAADPGDLGRPVPQVPGELSPLRYPGPRDCASRLHRRVASPLRLVDSADLRPERAGSESWAASRYKTVDPLEIALRTRRVSTGEITLEPTGSTDLERCECCGQNSRTVWGLARRDGAAHAAYFVHWTLGRVAEDGAHIDLILGRWGARATEADRYAVSLEFRHTERGPALM